MAGDTQLAPGTLDIKVSNSLVNSLGTQTIRLVGNRDDLWGF